MNYSKKAIAHALELLHTIDDNTMKKEAKTETQRTIAKNMLAHGSDLKFIATCTGLSTTQVAGLRSE